MWPQTRQVKAPSKLWYWTQKYTYNIEKLLDS